MPSDASAEPTKYPRDGWIASAQWDRLIYACAPTRGRVRSLILPDVGMAKLPERLVRRDQGVLVPPPFASAPRARTPLGCNH
jgi:hypothetical protein